VNRFVWMMSARTTAYLGELGARGRLPRFDLLTGSYTRSLLQLGLHDRQVLQAVTGVSQLLKPPVALYGPAMLGKVAMARVRQFIRPAA
jgi:hypothetical protein